MMMPMSAMKMSPAVEFLMMRVAIAYTF